MIEELFDGKRVIFLDIETTGVKFTTDHIIELGVVEYMGATKVKEYSRLFSGGSSPAFLVEKVHGITDEERKNEPTFAECAGKVAGYLSNGILCGHNIVNFDRRFIETKMALAGHYLKNVEYIDTLLLARRLNVGAKNNKLETLCEFYGLEYGNHRGLSDALSTRRLLLTLMDKFGVKHINEVLHQETEGMDVQ